MWKHKNFINLQLCAGNIVETTINWDSHITKVALGTVWEWTQSGQTDSQSGYTSLDFIVTLQDGYVIDTVTANNGFTVSNITDTTFHLNDGSQPSYEVTITITSKSNVQKLPTPTNVSITGTTVQWDEVANATSYDVLVDGEVWENVPQPSSGNVIKAGTYLFNEELTSPSSRNNLDLDFVAKGNSLTADNVYGNTVNIEHVLVQDTGFLSLFNTSNGEASWNLVEWVYNDGEVEYVVTDNTKLRTIIVETDQVVTDEFYSWFSTNTTKQ